MAKSALTSVASTEVLQGAAKPAPVEITLDEMGESGGKDALARLNSAVKELKAVAAAPLLKRAITALNREDYVEGGKWAVKALELDEHNGVGWYLLAMSRERAGDFANSVRAYEAALQLLPEQEEVANDLGRLAFRMGMAAQAEKLFRLFMKHAPHRVDGVNNLVTAIRDQGRTDEAIEILKAAILENPETAMLWNTMGSIMNDKSDFENAAMFFSEALRLDPKFGKARYNLSQAKLHMGDLTGALADCEAALKRIITAEDRAMMNMAKSTYKLALGRIAEGWDEYDARLSPQYYGVTFFLIKRPQWKRGTSLQGKNLLVVGEQGLGDEVLFANCLPDIIESVGPEGSVQIAVEKRLIPLFERNFPTCQVTSHVTNVLQTKPARRVPNVDLSTVDLWMPMGSAMVEYRRTHDAFPDHKGYLKPNPERIAHWRKVLEDAPPGLKVGLLWKSKITGKGRHRYFSPFAQWESILKTPGVTFVNLQYGDCSEEIQRAKEEFGVEIWQPPGIDLKDDLEDVSALCCAVDMTIGFSNATLNLAGAAGADIWLIAAPGGWPRLGAENYPWYPQARVFCPEGYNDWQPVMDEVAVALAERAVEA